MPLLTRLPRALLSAAALSSGALAAAVVLTPIAAQAQSAAKAQVDAAKASGAVGEEASGYLGFVRASGAAAGAVSEINAGRRAAYQQAAASTGVSATAAGEAAYRQLLARMPSGQWYKPAGGGWTQK